LKHPSCHLLGDEKTGAQIEPKTGRLDAIMSEVVCGWMIYLVDGVKTGDLWAFVTEKQSRPLRGERSQDFDIEVRHYSSLLEMQEHSKPPRLLHFKQAEDPAASSTLCTVLYDSKVGKM